MGMIGDLSFSVDLTKNFTKMGRAVAIMAKKMVKSTPKLQKWSKNFKAVSDAVAADDSVQKLGSIVQGLQTGIGTLGNLVSIGLEMFGVFTQMAESMGILTPIMDMIKMIFQIIGANALQQMIPAMEKMFQVLFSPEMMKFWGDLGKIIGDFMVFIIETITQLFGDPAVRKMIMLFLKIYDDHKDVE